MCTNNQRREHELDWEQRWVHGKAWRKERGRERRNAVIIIWKIPMLWLVSRYNLNTSQPSLLGELRASERPYLKKRWAAPEEWCSRLSLAYRYSHVHGPGRLKIVLPQLFLYINMPRVIQSLFKSFLEKCWAVCQSICTIFCMKVRVFPYHYKYLCHLYFCCLFHKARGQTEGFVYKARKHSAAELHTSPSSWF